MLTKRSARHSLARLAVVALAWLTGGMAGWADSTVSLDLSPRGRMQIIDGFGTCMGNKMAGEQWFQELYFDDLGASIERIDLTPEFKPPMSDHRYNSPGIMEAGGGPDKNRVRTYTGPADYGREFGGGRAAIAVMGPDIAKNIGLLGYTWLEPAGKLAQAGLARKAQLGDFKLVASIWSPAPWVKMTSGGRWEGDYAPKPAKGTPYPFIWNGDFSGGRLDVSDKPLAVFNDGSGPTSALTQFSRCTAAYVKGFQDKFGVRFYAISIQNEVNFEEFYKSATYPLSAQYIAAVKAVRREFDKYPDLKDIQIMGPEDLLGGDVWGMWQLGTKDRTTHKNLQYLKNIAADAEAAKAVSFFCIHGYAADGGTAAGADSKLWSWWVHGWGDPPNPALPHDVKGFSDYGKKSWITETSGEAAEWLSPAKGSPLKGAWSIAFKTQKALTTGRESAFIYWQFAEKADTTTTSCLTRKKDGAQEPKFVAAKHFFKFIRPGAVAVKASVAGDEGLLASAYVHEKNGTLTLVLVSTTEAARTARVNVPVEFGAMREMLAVTSHEGALWQESKVPLAGGEVEVAVPGYGVVSLQGHTP